jgi:UDP-N-acetylglucosamine 2-epimerase (non-hydrolysing)/GDP/UDP-N,N'-diacetylbacillosamine 2-epimerase (hydrolysing)
MGMGRRVCVVTGSRADYGLLYWVMRQIRDDPELELQIVATGMHLSPAHGMTVRQIETDGFRIDAKVASLAMNAVTTDMARSIGLGVCSLADCYAQLNPDLVLVLGDRFEILAAAIAAYSSNIPVAHIAGGDTTVGSLDEGFRHAITKMAHLHFVTNEMAERRVLMMGENPSCVFCVGNPGLDYVRRMKRVPRTDLEQALGFRFREKNILITFHPVTANPDSTALQFRELLEALRSFAQSEIGMLITYANADPGGNMINEMIEQFAAARPNAKAFSSLGQHLYLSLLAQVDAVVGNSSSGLCEAPSFCRPTVDIGDRQAGRLAAASVIQTPAVADKIRAAILRAFELDCRNVVNPYGDGNSSKRIVDHIKRTGIQELRAAKRYHDNSEVHRGV